LVTCRTVTATRSRTATASTAKTTQRTVLITRGVSHLSDGFGRLTFWPFSIALLRILAVSVVRADALGILDLPVS
jgi:hypothetical protein